MPFFSPSVLVKIGRDKSLPSLYHFLNIKRDEVNKVAHATPCLSSR